jgi:hypothetical protein
VSEQLEKVYVSFSKNLPNFNSFHLEYCDGDDSCRQLMMLFSNERIEFLHQSNSKKGSSKHDLNCYKNKYKNINTAFTTIGLFGLSMKI